MTLKALIPLDSIRVHLQQSEYAHAITYTIVDLTGTGSDVVRTGVVGLFDPAIDVESNTVIETGLEVVIGNGTITEITMATPAPSGIMRVGEQLTGTFANVTYLGAKDSTLYGIVTSGDVQPLDTYVGGTSGSSWSTHPSDPVPRIQGIEAPKAGDRFAWNGYDWQVEAVDKEHGPGTYLLAAKRGAPV